MGLLVGLFWAPRVGKKRVTNCFEARMKDLTYLREEADKIPDGRRFLVARPGNVLPGNDAALASMGQKCQSIGSALFYRIT